MKIPDYPRYGDSVEATVRSIIDYLKSSRITSFPGGMVKPSTGGTTLSLRPKTPEKPAKKPKPNPFDVVLLTEDGNHSVIIHDGIIIERFTGGTESATKEHIIENIKEGDGAFPPASAGDRVKFPVKIGDQVSVFFECRPDGSIKDIPTAIITKEDENPSIHWSPPAGDDTEGMFGEFWYKLATIEAGEQPGTAKIKPYLMGSHIDHWAEIPRLENTIPEATDNVGRVVRDFDKDLGRFNIRAIQSKHHNIKITETDTAIEIGTPDGYPDPSDGSILFVDCDNYELARLEWKGGLITTQGVTTVQVGSCDACSCSNPGGGSAS